MRCSPLSLVTDSITDILETGRRRTDDARPLRFDLEHREATLHQTVGRKAEQSVNSEKAVGIEDGLLGKRLAAPTPRQYRGESCCIIAERGKARRVMAIGCTVSTFEILSRLGRRRREPAANQRGLTANVGDVPEAAPEQPHRFGVSPRRSDLPGDLLELAAPFRQQQGIE